MQKERLSLPQLFSASWSQENICFCADFEKNVCRGWKAWPVYLMKQQENVKQTERLCDGLSCVSSQVIK